MSRPARMVAIDRVIRLRIDHPKLSIWVHLGLVSRSTGAPRVGDNESSVMAALLRAFCHEA